MTDKPRFESGSIWDMWVEIQKHAIAASSAGEWSRAFETVGQFLSGFPPAELEREALAFRADLQEERGDLVAALSDYLKAHTLSSAPSFQRCTLEESIANIYARLSRRAEAELWFLKALETAAADPTTCGLPALKGICRLRGAFLFSARETPIIEKVVAQCWRIYRLPGEPDLADLGSSAQAIERAQRAEAESQMKALAMHYRPPELPP